MPPAPRRRLLPLIALAIPAVLLAAGGETAPSEDAPSTDAPLAAPDLRAASPVDLPGLENVVAYGEAYYSGGVPTGPDSFATLAAMGVRTVISVDGAPPDVAAAAAHGIRYIHLPIGYDGFDAARRLELARASADARAKGAVYVHCHHGKHRSAGAAGAAAVTLGWASPDDMLDRMRVSGTSPNYPGLFEVVRRSTPASRAELAAVDADFPSVSMPKGLVKSMVEVSHAWEHLLAIRKASWTVPATHPDLVPAAEAGRLADILRLLESDAAAQKHGVEFIRLLRANQREAQRLEDLLVALERDPAALTAQFDLVKTSCRACHARYRD